MNLVLMLSWCILMIILILFVRLIVFLLTSLVNLVIHLIWFIWINLNKSILCRILLICILSLYLIKWNVIIILFFNYHTILSLSWINHLWLFLIFIIIKRNINKTWSHLLRILKFYIILIMILSLIINLLIFLNSFYRFYLNLTLKLLRILLIVTFWNI